MKAIAPAEVTGIDVTRDEARVTLHNGQIIAAQLVVGADGRRSACRAMMGIGSYGWDYRQTALVCTVAHSLPHDDTAVENFQTPGPLATLPMTGQRSSVVWCAKAPPPRPM